MNIGYEEDELKPFVEPSKDLKNEGRIAKLVQIGYSRNSVLGSLEKEAFDEIHATYLLLGERHSEVTYVRFFFKLITSVSIRFHNIRLEV